jgi:hypothetical protein
MLTTETQPIEEQPQKWQPHPFSIGKHDGWKGYVPTEEHHLNEEYQRGYFAGIHARYQSQQKQ